VLSEDQLHIVSSGERIEIQWCSLFRRVIGGTNVYMQKFLGRKNKINKGEAPLSFN
jgi:hypothetical protein